MRTLNIILSIIAFVASIYLFAWATILSGDWWFEVMRTYSLVLMVVFYGLADFAIALKSDEP